MSKVIVLKRTYVQILTMPSKKFKNFLSPNIAAPSTRQHGYQKQGPSHTFFNIKTKGSHNFQGTSPVIFSFKKVRWLSFVNKCYWDVNWKRGRISRIDQENIMLIFHKSLFLALEFPWGVTQFYGMCKSKALFCLEFPRVKW